MEVIYANPGFKMIASYGVAFNHIDVAAATERRMPFANTPGLLAPHLGGATTVIWTQMGIMAVENLLAICGVGRPPNVVNLQVLHEERTS